MKRSIRLFWALLVALMLVATACDTGGNGDGGDGKATPTEEGKPGGTLVFAAEQYPECLNVVTSCANASWLFYTINGVVPSLLFLDADNNYKASPLVTKIPSTENGLVTENPFTVTYELNKKAVWEDGTPITGEDVKFTWEAVMKTPEALSTVGYDKIKDITTQDNKVKIEFTEPYAPWKNLFLPGPGVLKKAAFGGNPDVSTAMQTSYGFSGGPFKLDSYTEQEMILSRNDKFWGKKALLDKIIFRPIEDSTAEVNAFKTGEVQAFFPQPTVELVDQIKAIDGGEIAVKGGTVYEGLWFQLGKDPVRNREVREALLYGLDRQIVVDQIVKPIDPEAAVNHCLFSVPNLADGKYCPKDFPTTSDKARATKVLEDAGWKKGADGIYAKGGKKLTVKLATTAGNKGREQAQQILIAQAKEIGIEIVADNSPPTVLFQTRLPALNFTMAMFAFVATPDPSVTSNFAKDQIPTKAKPDGANQIGWANDEATKLMYESDKEVDDDKRTDLMTQINKLAFQDIVSIPMFAKPQILVYNSNRLGGDFDFNAGQAGFAHQLSTWYFKNEADRTSS